MPSSSAESSANFFQHLTAGIGAAPGRLDAAEKLVQFVEIELPHVVDGLAADGKQQPRRA